MSGTVLLTDIGLIDLSEVRSGSGPCTAGPDLLGAVESGSGYVIPESKYADIPGARVVIRDEADDIVGTAALPTTGEFQLEPDAGCSFAFTADSEPSDFYTVEIGERDGVTVTASEAKAGLELKL